jgi:hypothetical protein
MNDWVTRRGVQKKDVTIGIFLTSLQRIYLYSHVITADF